MHSVKKARLKQRVSTGLRAIFKKLVSEPLKIKELVWIWHKLSVYSIRDYQEKAGLANIALASRYPQGRQHPARRWRSSR
ncbi:hypothetical protein TERTU_4370 [Teredinibacter turnerae T7901]|uniref:Uncharacterized protein n=1 Tax=Teredinibacter turnerae (strain ATCC 39867 / T7901) TaxID=377629 RepID=C5BIX1_TERTT|nr:hypothetical protein [Teredinibacter turnerae]ACR12065.1 hypothetical protein TERTU_4370 [Teredinibacter turnerae T7901]